MSGSLDKHQKGASVIFSLLEPHLFCERNDLLSQIEEFLPFSRAILEAVTGKQYEALLGKDGMGLYAAVMKELDDNVGKVLARLDEHGIFPLGCETRLEVILKDHLDLRWEASKETRRRRLNFPCHPWTIEQDRAVRFDHLSLDPFGIIHANPTLEEAYLAFMASRGRVDAAMDSATEVSS